MRRIFPILLILISVSFGLAQQPAAKPDNIHTQALLDKVGLKFEYDRVHMNAMHQDINFGGTQLVFTF